MIIQMLFQLRNPKSKGYSNVLRGYVYVLHSKLFLSKNSFFQYLLKNMTNWKYKAVLFFCVNSSHKLQFERILYKVILHSVIYTLQSMHSQNMITYFSIFRILAFKCVDLIIDNKYWLKLCEGFKIKPNTPMSNFIFQGLFVIYTVRTWF